MCCTGLAGHNAGLAGHNGKVKELLELSAVPYSVQRESMPTRSWRTRGLSIVKGVIAKCELTMSLLVAFNLGIQCSDFSTTVIVFSQQCGSECVDLFCNIITNDGA